VIDLNKRAVVAAVTGGLALVEMGDDNDDHHRD
jgi:hypothetical protein